MGIEDHFLQEFQDIYQSKTFQYKSDKWVVSSNNVLYSGYRQEFIDHILQEWHISYHCLILCYNLGTVDKLW